MDFLADRFQCHGAIYKSVLRSGPSDKLGKPFSGHFSS